MFFYGMRDIQPSYCFILLLGCRKIFLSSRREARCNLFTKSKTAFHGKDYSESNSHNLFCIFFNLVVIKF